MEQHHFKVIYSAEDDVYRIIDLTDTSIVGVTEMYENDDEVDKEVRAELYNEIKSHKRLGAKVVGYGIFVFLDENNTSSNILAETDYLQSVLRQMARFFERGVVQKEPKQFERYAHPQKRNITTDKREQLHALAPQAVEKGQEQTPNTSKKTKHSKWLKGWRLAIIIICAAILLGFITALIISPSFRSGVADTIEFIFILPFGIIVLLAYAGDMFARR